MGYLLIQELYQLGRLIKLVVKDKSPAWSGHVNPFGDSCYRGLLIFYGIFTLASYPPYYANSIVTHVPQTIGIVLGWAFLMFFTRAWKPFSYFTVIIQSAFVDIARFALMYLMMLIPFSAAMSILFQFSSVVPEFSTMQSSLLTMFQLTLGLSEVDVTEGATYPGMALVLYIAYLAMTYILLLNMVIALLSDTCNRVASNRKKQWHLQKLAIILFIEARLHPKFRSKIGSKRKTKKLTQIASQHDSEVPLTMLREHHPNEHRHPGSVKRKRSYLQVTSLVDPTSDDSPTSAGLMDTLATLRFSSAYD